MYINTKTRKQLLKHVSVTGILLIAMLMSLHTMAQMTDSAKGKPQKEYKNTIKINLTSWALYSGFQLNYERLLTKHTSFTVWGGPIEFPMPTIIANSSIVLNTDKQGNVFQKDGNNWQQRSGNGWQNVNQSRQGDIKQLNQQQQTQNRGNTRTNNYNQSRQPAQQRAAPASRGGGGGGRGR